MEIRAIAVIGAGTEGRAVARAALAAGYRTILEDVVPERLSAAEAELRSGTVATGAFSTCASVAEASREADLVIETLPDEAEMKVDVFCILEKFARPRAVLATNARAITVTELAAVTTRGEWCVGLRIPQLGVVEIVSGCKTAEETVKVCREVARRMGRAAVVTQEAEGAASAGTAN